MSSLSIVVPRLGSDSHFESTLASVLRYRLKHHQVIVVQTDLHADTWGLREEVDFVEVAGRPRLARYYNEALKVATGDTMHIVRPGIEVTHHWFAYGIRQLQKVSCGCVAASLVSACHRDEIISRGITAGRHMLPVHVADRRQKPLGPSTWAGFYRTCILQAIGEVDESLSDDFLGLDLALGIRGLGYQCGVITDRVLTIASRQMLRCRFGHRTGRDAQRMIQRHLPRREQRTGAAIAFGCDLASSLWRPDRWSQVAGRFSARHRQATDSAFSRRLAVAKHELAEALVSRNLRRAA